MSASLFRIDEHVVPGQHIREYPRATANDQEEVFRIHFKQYRPLNNLDPRPGDVTILSAHANGFPKELYEPLWDEILHRGEQQGFRIRGIWIADVSNQGASGVLNENVLGNDPSWMDHSRDLLLAVNHFRNQMPRPIVGVGHSFGGAQLVTLSLLHPRLLTSLVLLDPVIQRFSINPTGPSPALASANRRDRWPSRAAAEAAFKRSKFYQTWDPRVLERWVRHGVRELPTAIFPESQSPLNPHTQKEVTLTTTKHQEVFTFLRPTYQLEKVNDTSTGGLIVNRKTHPDLDPAAPKTWPFYRPEPPLIMSMLPHLRPSVLYIFGDESTMSAPQFRKEKLDVTGVGVGGSGGVAVGRVKEVVLQGVGHLVAMEAVQACADAAGEWLGKELQLWREGEEAFQREWQRTPLQQKTTLGQDYLHYLGPNPRSSKTTAPSKL